MLLLRGKTGMYQTSRNSILTAAAGVASEANVRRSTGLADARIGPVSTNERTASRVGPSFGVTHVLNTLRYVLFGTGAYAPPIGKFNV